MHYPLMQIYKFMTPVYEMKYLLKYQYLNS